MHRTLVVSGFSALLVLTFVSFSSAADTTVTIQNTQAGKEPEPQTVRVTQGKVRLEQSSGEGTVLIYHQANNTFFAIQPTRKSYMELDPERMGKMMDQASQAQRKVVEQLRERMAGMSEAERQQMQGMLDRMGQSMPQQQVERVRYEPRSDRGEAGGLACRWIDAFQASRKVRELCIADWNAIGFASADRQTMMGMQKSMQAVAERFGNAGMFVDDMPDGFPVHVRHLGDSGELSSEQKLQSVSSESLDSSLFEVPAGYKRQELPQMPR